MKKWLIVLSIVIVFVIRGEVNAANMQSIATNTPIVDMLEDESDEKYYQFTVDKAGYFTISLKKQDPTADVRNGWEVHLYDMNGKCLKSAYGLSTAWTSCKFSFEKGTQLYVKIANNDGNIYEGAYGNNYVFSINSIEDSNWEQEYNDGINKANAIYGNVTKCASMWNGSDNDYFRYVVDKQGYFSVSFDKADPTYDMRFGVWVILYDGAGNKIESTRFEASGKTSTYNFVKGETIYIRVVAYSSYPGENPSGLEYKLTINSVEDATWEVENRHDDNSSFADRIANAKKLTGNVLNGHLWCGSDVDLYRVVATTPSYMTVDFKVNEVSSNLKRGYDLILYNQKGEKKDFISGITSDKKWKVYVGKGVYYVSVKANYYNSYPDSKKYSISQSMVSMKKELPKKKVVIQAGKNMWGQSVVKWTTEIEGVAGYKVYRSTNKKKGFKCIETVKGDSAGYIIDKKAKSGKNYYYKVRAYKKIGGKTYYSKYSSVKKVRG